MEDDHVDRPGVEAQQCVQLTGTNSSFGLIALINQRPSIWTTIQNHLLLRAFPKPHHFRKVADFSNQADEQMTKASVCLSPAWWLSAKRPDPIPSRTRPSNASAPMVLCLKTRESRSPPGLPKTNKTSSQTKKRQQRPKPGRCSRFQSMIPKSCRLFGQDHALKTKIHPSPRGGAAR